MTTIAGCLLAVCAVAQTPVLKSDSTAGKTVGAYKKVIPDNAKGQRGLFDISQVDQKWFFEIPDSLLGRYLLAVTRFASTAQGMGDFGGEQLREATVYFEKGNNNNLFLRGAVFAQESADIEDALNRALIRSQENPIIASFDIKAINPQTGGYVIEVTDLFKKDVSILAFTTEQKSSRKLAGLADDRSFIERINTYPINIEIKTTKTYAVTLGLTPSGAMSGFTTLRLNTSLLLLPKVAMKKRIADERVGFFTNKYLFFDGNKQRVEAKQYIQRYRLEPKEEDMAKYRRGILVEPKKQIVYYLDPATPKKWRPYLIKGINDWQKAFESAGFKNAIVGQEWPESDTTMSLEDARFSVVRYFASEKPNAYGPRITDPRSGEIMESHLGWYHNVMKLVHNWYMVQAGPLDPRARKMEFEDKLMGELMRLVLSHEIGHSLGLRHNMGASSQTPVEKLRDKTWVERNGHTVSIMDYARFNYVAQPEDHISTSGIYPRIGAYDKWAIDFGYRYYENEQSPLAEEKMLTRRVTDTLTRHPQLWFGREGKDEDPRSQTEDLGDDAVAASDYGIKNLKRVVPNLMLWTKQEGDHYDNLMEIHQEVLKQYSRYLFHVQKYIGSRYFTPRSSDETLPVYAEVPKAKVKAAVDYLARQLFDPPLWLFPKEISAFVDMKASDFIAQNQANALSFLLSQGLLFNLSNKTLYSQDPYPIGEYLNDLQLGIWKKPIGSEVQQNYVRGMQRVYIEKMGMLINPRDVAEGKAMNTIQRSDVRLEAISHIKNIKGVLSALVSNTTGIAKLHFEDMSIQIDKMLLKTRTNL